MERCLDRVGVTVRSYVMVQVIERCLHKAEIIVRIHIMVQVMKDVSIKSRSDQETT